VEELDRDAHAVAMGGSVHGCHRADAEDSVEPVFATEGGPDTAFDPCERLVGDGALRSMPRVSDASAFL
jgi:hypothetical protein